MFNRYLFNASRFAHAQNESVVSTSSDAFVFNNYGLQNTAIITEEATYDSMPILNHPMAKSARNDGMVALQHNFNEKPIVLRGFITKSTAALLEAELSTFKNKLSPETGNLDITPSGQNKRRYVATLMNTENIFARRRGYHISLCPFDLVFACKSPFGHELNYTTDQDLDFSGLVNGKTITVTGEAPASPLFQINISAASAITALEIKNVTRDETLTITRTFSAGENVVVDCENQTVKIDSSNVNYTGVFMKMDKGDNDLTITFTGTSITYTMDTKYKPTYY